MKNKIIYVSGIVNLETIVNVDAFPIYYNPVEYPFFGINSTVSGSAYNIAKALKKLGNNDVFLSAHVGKDMVGDIVINEIEKNKIDTSYIKYSLDYTPNSVVFVDRDNNVKNYSDLKDVQEISQEITNEIGKIKRSDLIVLSNTNFNRPLLKKAKELGKKVATDVHIIGTIDDEFNKDFMKYSDISFLSKKGLSNINYEDFLLEIYNKYHNEIIVLGEGREGEWF